jgi:hypothetical protein
VVAPTQYAAAERFPERADRGLLAPQWRLDGGILDRRSGARNFLANR